MSDIVASYGNPGMEISAKIDVLKTGVYIDVGAIVAADVASDLDNQYLIHLDGRPIFLDHNQLTLPKET